jgi:glycosyltransferase involved in cell wall biosynthesis
MLRPREARTPCHNRAPMTFSALLPTRNRLEYLRFAVESVLRQDDPDWELVISDNDSEEDIAGYVASLGDDRVRYVRTDAFVPVTENWNNALRHSTGEHFVMLGDDDALLPGYFSAMRRHIERFGAPEAIYTSAMLYAYPGVDAAAPRGYLQPYGYASFLRGATEPFVLDRAVAHRAVRQAMDFRVRYGFNMQFALVSRRLADRIAGDGEFFRSPFPDYFAMNMVMLRAAPLLVDPAPRVVIGVTPRSYGFFHANQLEREARSFLEGESAPDDDRLLPGTNINNGWLLAMDAVSRAAGDPELRPNRRRYRMLQALYVYEHHHFGSITREQLDELRARLPRRERLVYDAGFAGAAAVARVLPPVARRAARHAFALAQRQTPYWRPGRDRGDYGDMREVLDRFEPPRPTVPAGA